MARNIVATATLSITERLNLRDIVAKAKNAEYNPKVRIRGLQIEYYNIIRDIAVEMVD